MGKLVKAKVKKPKCCGDEAGDLTTIKLDEKECSIAVFICGVCGRIFDETRSPLIRGGKRVFLIRGKVESR